MRLIAPPLPAASRASNTTTTLSPSSLMYSWSLTNSSWSLASSASYAPRLILPVLSRLSSPPALPTASSAAAVPCAVRMSAFLLALPLALFLVLSSDLIFVFATALLPDTVSDWHTWSHIESYHNTSVTTTFPQPEPCIHGLLTPL